MSQAKPKISMGELVGKIERIINDKMSMQYILRIRDKCNSEIIRRMPITPNPVVDDPFKAWIPTDKDPNRPDMIHGGFGICRNVVNSPNDTPKV